MAGLVIHLAVAQEYLKYNREDDEKNFLYGSIQPDFVTPKSISHYGKSPSFTCLKNFLLSNEINTSLKRGQFLHLITDYLFYNHYLPRFDRQEMYHDYQVLNKPIIEKYNVNVIEEAKEYSKSIEGNTNILSYEMACKMIDEISMLNLEKVKEEALNDNKKWNYFSRICEKK